MNRHPLAKWFERLFANLIDSLILLVPSAAIAQDFSDAKGAVLLPLFALNMAYVVGFLSSSWQATPGKRLLNIYVIHADGSRLSPRDALERFLAFILPSLAMYSTILSETTAQMLTIWLSMLWFVPILTTPERTGLHDKLCHTRVVAGRADTPNR